MFNNLEEIPLEEQVRLYRLLLIQTYLTDGFELRGDLVKIAKEKAKKHGVDPSAAVIVAESLVRQMVDMIFETK